MSIWQQDEKCSQFSHFLEKLQCIRQAIAFVKYISLVLPFCFDYWSYSKTRWKIDRLVENYLKQSWTNNFDRQNKKMDIGHSYQTTEITKTCFFLFIHMIWKHRQHSKVKRTVCVKLFIYWLLLICIFSVSQLSN